MANNGLVFFVLGATIVLISIIVFVSEFLKDKGIKKKKILDEESLMDLKKDHFENNSENNSIYQNSQEKEKKNTYNNYNGYNDF